MSGRRGAHASVGRTLSRRNFLRAAGGISVALPLLHSLRADATGTVFPKRLVLFYNPNGTVPAGWWPTNVTTETAFDLSPIHAPLVKHRDKLLILKGLDIAVASVGPGGPHQRGIGGLFTGRELQEGSFVDGCGSKAGWANGISVDQEVAGHVESLTMFKSLELGVRASDDDVQGRIVYAGAGQPLPPMNAPLDVYKRLFSAMDTSGTDLELLKAERRSVLDVVQEQFTALRPRIGTADRDKLDQHLSMVRDLELRLGASANSSSACTVPGAPSMLDPNSEDDMPEILRLHLDLLAMAFACDLTRVASVQVSTALNRIRFPWLNSLDEGHTLSHSADTDAKSQEQLVQRAIWHAENIAYFMDRLAEIPEGTGSVLDNTLILWGNEVSRGNTHAHTDMPFLLIGSAGGHFQTGRFVQFTSKSHNDLLVSVLNAMDVPAMSFGHPDFCSGPLSGLT